MGDGCKESIKNDYRLKLQSRVKMNPSQIFSTGAVDLCSHRSAASGPNKEMFVGVVHELELP